MLHFFFSEPLYVSWLRRRFRRRSRLYSSESNLSAPNLVLPRRNVSWTRNWTGTADDEMGVGKLPSCLNLARRLGTPSKCTSKQKTFADDAIVRFKRCSVEPLKSYPKPYLTLNLNLVSWALTMRRAFRATSAFFLFRGIAHFPSTTPLSVMLLFMLMLHFSICDTVADIYIVRSYLQ